MRALLHKFGNLFGDMRKGEGKVVAILTANIFVAMVCYYIIKTVREPLILTTGGAELKTYASGVQAALLMLAVPAYSWLTSRLPRQKSIPTLLIFFLVCIEAFFALGLAETPMLGFAFYVWVGIFSLVVIAQFWSFANDVFDTDRGERLFPIVAIGMTGGSWVGSVVAAALFDSGLGPFIILQVSAALLVVHTLLYWLSEKTIDFDEHSAEDEAKEDEALDKANGFALIFKNSYLILIAVLMLLLNLVNTLGEYVLADLAKQAAEAAYDGSGDKEAFVGKHIGTFYGTFFSFVNAAGVFLQAFVASRIVKWFGIRGVLFALPLVSLGTYAFAAAGVGLAVFRWAKTAENSTDYSIMNTAKAMLWLPTTREEKYNAKQAVDTFFVRAGDVAAALVVYFIIERFSMESYDVGKINIGIIALWLVLTFFLARRYIQLKKEKGIRDEDAL